MTYKLKYLLGLRVVLLGLAKNSATPVAASFSFCLAFSIYSTIQHDLNIIFVLILECNATLAYNVTISNSTTLLQKFLLSGLIFFDTALNANYA